MKAVVSLLVAACVAVIAGTVAAFAVNGLGLLSAHLSLLAGLAAGGMAWRSISRREAGMPGWRNGGVGRPGWPEWTVIVLFTLFALRAFCWVAFFKEGDLAFLSPNNLGDLSLHLTFIEYFANGVPFWPKNPIYSAADLHYPFGVDLLNSLLLLVGVDLIRGLVWVGLLGALATGVTLWRWGGAFAMAGFLFNGGFAAWRIFETHRLADFQDQVAWKSIPLALFVTQRGLLYALPAGLALLWSWRNRFLRRERGLPFLPFWVEALLYATMPLFHLHTFLFLSAMLGSWLAFSYCGAPGRLAVPPQARRGILRLIGTAFIPATGLILLLTGCFRSGGAIHWKAGWMQGGQNPFLFWFENFGLLPVGVVALLLWLGRRAAGSGSEEFRKEAVARLAMVVPAVAIFLLTCFVMFAAWEWDNTKLMIWSYLAILPALWAMLRTAAPWLRAIACGLLFFSGFLSLLGGLDASHQGHALARREELDSLRVSLDGIPVTATFAAFPTYNHPLLLLGHKAVAGYDGHLMSHGIDYLGRKADLESLLRGEPGWEDRARLLGVDYLFWGSREEKAFGGASAAWGEKAPVAAQGDWGTIYDLRGLSGGQP